MFVFHTRYYFATVGRYRIASGNGKYTGLGLRVPYTQYGFLSVFNLHVSEGVPVRKKKKR